MSSVNSAMGPVQTVVYTALTGDTGLQALVGTRIFDEVLPGGYSEFPYVQLGEIVETPQNVFGGATGAGRVVDQTIHIYSQAKGWQEAQGILDALVRIIDLAGVLPNPAGWKTYASLYTSGREIRDPDGTRHIVARFQIQVGLQ